MADEQNDRPTHIEIDCSTGAVTHTVLADQEIEDMRQAQVRADREHRARVDADAELARAAADHPDPLVKALAQRAGLL